ncbi:DUF1616 domain-containing protein [Promethearchaeum syntrophicum]|uniref:DUF1616 domain-containing protein n=1 Tax=Promethearchaeum syntrophicum TaxID=2594042 RepID=A0A5B9D9B0_9ARCH|nr:DUF1616 domain-containing protein [Candidatus Prometheoarchaeum syntrophicum]QEE15724.1 hypothetical protein DSAG12_01551 [Candidatus Prometheoarchaeum syntrophicum]
MSEDSENFDWKSGLTLEKITKIVLIAGIIVVSGAMIYTFTKTEEPDLLFFLLNENQEMKDFQTNSTVGENVSIYTFIENQLGYTENFSVRVYRGNSNISINRSIGVSENINASYLFNYTYTLENEQSIISDMIDVSFIEAGLNQSIILELWTFTENGWDYFPEYILIQRFAVYL